MATTTDVAEICADTLNHCLRERDCGPAIDLFADDILISYQMGEEAEQYVGEEGLRAWLSGMSSEWRFVAMKTQSSGYTVEGDFEIREVSPSPLRGHWSFDLTSEGKIKRLFIAPTP